MPKYYIEFKTWAEGDVNMPWPMVWFEEVNDYRHKNDLKKRIDPIRIRSVFSSFDDKAVGRFMQEHVPALILGCTMDLEHPGEILDELSRIFGYCEVLGVCEVNDRTRERINEMMKNAG